MGEKPFRDAQVGDKVLVSSGSWRSRVWLGTVTRTTKATVEVAKCSSDHKCVFNRRTGNERGTNGYYGSSARLASDSEWEDAKAEIKAHNMANETTHKASEIEETLRKNRDLITPEIHKAVSDLHKTISRMIDHA